MFRGLAFDAAVWGNCGRISRPDRRLFLRTSAIRTSPEAMRKWLNRRGRDHRFCAHYTCWSLCSRRVGRPRPNSGFFSRGRIRSTDTRRANVPFRVVNNYGPTECTVVATSGVLLPRSNSPEALPPIGTPIANTQIYLLDNNREPVAEGNIGEIYIGGTSVGRGLSPTPPS